MHRYTHTYKMRAECVHDVGTFLQKVATRHVAIEDATIEGAWIPDVTVTFTSPWSLAQLKGAIAAIEDGHVMLETVAFEDEYTGERR